MSTLDTFLQIARPPPEVVVTSQEIRDRGSIFVGSVYRANSVEDAKAAARHHKHVVHAGKKVAHEISAWRCMVLKPGRTGLQGPDDFELRTGYDDDGEQWAGAKILKVMQLEGAIDAVVVVSRWFGGTLLGPARFQHIETCASEVCRKFRKVEEMEECIQTLATLDDLLATLRTELDALNSKADAAKSRSNAGEDTGGDATSGQTQKQKLLIAKTHDYSAMRDALDLTKARRLIRAREGAITSVKALIARHKDAR
ncbi:hypothetical protein ID866_3601 [Astraeus odoratus]|nr:hypothetical protein ID866_3601 [Astraeus odoratus]